MADIVLDRANIQLLRAQGTSQSGPNALIFNRVTDLSSYVQCQRQKNLECKKSNLGLTSSMRLYICYILSLDAGVLEHALVQ